MEKAHQAGRAVFTKTDLIWNIGAATGLSQKDAALIIETILNAMVKALRQGGKVEIRGFGSFRIRQRQPRLSRNPSTGVAVMTAAKMIAYFTTSQPLLRALNKG